jgi:tubulin polyglutamylase TTLL6/13
MNNMCFEILGMDILLDANLKPYLLEVNHTPSFTTDTPLDKVIKKNLIRDALLLLDISGKNKVRIKNNLKNEF